MAHNEDRQVLFRVDAKILDIQDRLRPLTNDERAHLRKQLYRLRAIRKKLAARLHDAEQPSLLEEQHGPPKYEGGSEAPT